MTADLTTNKITPSMFTSVCRPTMDSQLAFLLYRTTSKNTFPRFSHQWLYRERINNGDNERTFVCIDQLQLLLHPFQVSIYIRNRHHLDNNGIRRKFSRLPDALSLIWTTQITDCNRANGIDHTSRDPCHLSVDEC